MGVLDREEINAFTKEIVEATTEAARDAILAKLTGGGAIKSVQRGVISIAKKTASGTATISSVDTTKAFVVQTGSIAGTFNAYDGGNSTSMHDAQLVLTSATKVTASVGFSQNYTTTSVPYQVVEFY